jgi:hypothetical protein
VRSAPSRRSLGRSSSSVCGRQRNSTTSTPRKEAALRQKLAPGPTVAIRRPPMAGPMARATLKPTLLSATAAGSRSGPTSSETLACHDGELRAEPRPIAKVRSSSVQASTRSSSVSAPSVAAAASIQACVATSSRRRSTRSARAPAGSASRNIGRLVAACTAATIGGDGARLVISQAAPTSCTQVPRFDAIVASQRARKSGSRSGSHGAIKASGGGVVRGCAMHRGL